MARALLDANIILEILFDRKLSQQCQQIISDPSDEYAISALTVHIVWYLAERHKLVVANVKDMLSVLQALPISGQALRLANERYDGRDYEDCLQAACAETNNCQKIITIDKTFTDVSSTSLPVTVVN